MTREEIENIPELVDLMLDKCVLADSRTKVCERLKEVCNLAIKTVEQEPCEDWYDLPSDEMTLEQARQAVKDLRKKLSEHLEQEPCKDANANQHNSNALNDVGQHKNALKGDAISRLAALEKIHWLGLDNDTAIKCDLAIRALPPVNPQEPKTGHCKDCKYFEYDSWANVNGIPLIVAHEICKRWGDGCKTWEDGYCFLFEPQESEDKE